MHLIKGLPEITILRGLNRPSQGLLHLISSFFLKDSDESWKTICYSAKTFHMDKRKDRSFRGIPHFHRALKTIYQASTLAVNLF